MESKSVERRWRWWRWGGGCGEEEERETVERKEEVAGDDEAFVGEREGVEVVESLGEERG